MARPSKSLKVPKAMQSTFDAITELTDRVCAEHLNEEYAELARQATAALARKRPSPLARGWAKSWACGVLYALGYINFLWDPNTEPYMSTEGLCDCFGVSQSTGYAKSRTVRDALNMKEWDSDWCLPSQMADNPLLWMVSVNGLAMDARWASREIQEAAYKQGIIPYIPAKDGTPAADQTLTNELVPGPDSRVYQIKVTLLGVQPPVWRYFQVLGESTLYDLHCVLQVVMGWQESHLHMFAAGEEEYTTLYDGVDLGREVIEDDTVTLAEVAPSEGMKFEYLYDFGDSWRHEVLVQKILEPDPDAAYPVCLGGERACPPEDCGGIWGYEELLEALGHPDHEEHDELLEWLGGSFDPEAFDLDRTNRALKEAKAQGYVR
ncbi:MAG: plasmid pRiA4b ORF-3 family protein [Planctomycetota bacterium]